MLIRSQYDGCSGEESLGVENTLWANTAVASGSALGIVVYTGKETRTLMSHSVPRSKVGLLDLEIHQLTKVEHVTIDVTSRALLKRNFRRSSSSPSSAWP